ncbi:MAG: M20/M25/M40 family metallo-hydrolase [Elusimicrobiota bacterium]|nr:M20/M25/M40 family metallo-hydrolase [Elusimicrobiota bacterium]
MNIRRPLAALLALLVASPAPAQRIIGRAPVAGSLGARPIPLLPPAEALRAPAIASAFVLPSLTLTPSAAASLRTGPLLGRAVAAADAVRLAAGAAGMAAPADAPTVPPAPLGAAAEGPGAFAKRAMDLFAGRSLESHEALAVAYKPAAARAEGAIPGDDELTSRVARSPLTNRERMDALIELFKLGGATDADIVLQDAGRGASNVIVTKRGRSDRVIVVGAHYDKVHEGRGVIDNWTGSTLVANLHQAFHGVDTEATIVFIAFAREEEGLIGASQYVRSLSREQRAKIDAMVNLDTLAVDGTFAWQGNSTQVLVDRIVQVAAATNHPAQAARLTGGDADSSVFRRAGIPAVTVFGASQDVIFDIIHSENDNMAAFNFVHYKNAYELVIEVLKSLDARPLGAEGRRRV